MQHPDVGPAPPRTREPDRDSLAPPAPIVVQVPGAGRSPLGTALQAVLLLVLGVFLLAMLLVLAALAQAVALPGRIAGGVGDRVGGVAAEAGRVVSEGAQALREAADPARPPTGLTYDAEYASLRVIRFGERLPDAREYVLTLKEVRRRDGADSPAVALYAVVYGELREPRQTRLLGQVIRTDADPREHVLYKGESFRVGRTIYRVNWISLEDSAMAVLAYRDPDGVTARLKFEYD